MTTYVPGVVSTGMGNFPTSGGKDRVASALGNVNLPILLLDSF